MTRWFLVLAGSVGTFVLLLVADAFGNRLLEGALSHARRRVTDARLNRRRRTVESGAAERWLVSYYQGREIGPDLPVVRHGSAERTLGLYAPVAWLRADTSLPLDACGKVQSAENYIVRDVPARLPRSVARRTRRLGQTIWDGDAMAVTRLPSDYADGLDSRNVGYFELVEAMVALEDEAMRCALSRVWRPRWRDRRPARSPSDPSGLGGTAVIVIDEGDGSPSVLVHRRSETVATQNGMWCAIPTYMWEDPRAAGRDPSGYDLRVWNLLRELLEEVFGWDDLSHVKGRPDPDWFFHELEDGKFLARLLEEGSMRLCHLGWSRSLMHGLVDSMTLVHINGSVEDRAQFRRSVRGTSTELHGREGSIRWTPLWSDELSEMLVRPTFHPMSALAIRLTREHFAALAPSPP